MADGTYTYRKQIHISTDVQVYWAHMGDMFCILRLLDLWRSHGILCTDQYENEMDKFQRGINDCDVKRSEPVLPASPLHSLQHDICIILRLI
jgi:hypothetical protein